MKNLYSLFFISILFGGMINAQQIAISIDSVCTNNIEPGSLINVNVNVDSIIYGGGVSAVIGAELRITYDPFVLTAQNEPFVGFYTNLNPYFLESGASLMTALPSPGDWRMIISSGGIPGIQITSPSVMFSIPFIWNGGSSDLTWDPNIDFTGFTFLPGYPKDGYAGFCNPVGTPEAKIEEINIWSNKNKIYIKLKEPIAGNIIIYNLLGKEVAHKNLVSGLNTISMDDDRGYHLVRVIRDGGVVTHKVYLH